MVKCRWLDLLKNGISFILCKLIYPGNDEKLFLMLNLTKKQGFIFEVGKQVKESVQPIFYTELSKFLDP